LSNRSLWISGLLLFIAIIVFVAVFEIPRQRKASQEWLKGKQHEMAVKNFEDLKSGDKTFAHIFLPGLMPMIAQDPELVARITHLHFDMMDLTSPEFQQIQKFPNVSTLGFYDCTGIETFLKVVANMQSVTQLNFYYLHPTAERLKLLAAIPALKKLRFNDLGAGELDIYSRALPNVDVAIYEDQAAR
jgi:hypothetical protein